MLVTSRAVVTGPPVPGVPAGPHDPVIGAPAVVAMATMAALVVMEIALLTGPAFAVGLRRRRRQLALIAAQGGSARHLRLVVLADGLILGAGAALLGLVGGIGVVAAGVQLVQALDVDLDGVFLLELFTYAGPLDVPWTAVVPVAVLGAVSGIAAAVVPAV